jgi:hypothetical protein
MTASSLAQAHRQFERALPAMDNTIRYQFRRWPRRLRAEAIADARASAWHAWIGLLRRGKDPLAVGPTGIAFNATRYVRAHRKLGCGATGRSAIDVYDRRSRCRLGMKLIRLDAHTGMADRAEPDAWREWLAEDNRVSPADEAAFRLDFRAWMDSLPGHKRRIAELLALGHETGAVAARLGVTPSAVSQSRTWLARSWRRFQGEAEAAPR